MNASQPDIKTALEDVRKAYRLLHAYQARVLDIVKYISKSVNSNLQSAWPWYTDTSVKGKIDLDNWSFDWLPMYLYEFVLVNGKIGERECKFSVIIVSDTGFADGGLDWKLRNQVRAFAPVEKSGCQIVFMAGENAWHKRELNMLSSFKLNASELVETGTDWAFVAKSYSFESFVDKSSIDKVMADFVTFCNLNKVSFIRTLSSITES